MEYKCCDNNIILRDIPDFNLAQTLECGQCFHFIRIDDGKDDEISDYALAAFGKVLRVSQTGDTFTFYDTSEEELLNIWVPYFDLERDYGEIKRFITERNPELESIIEKNAGIRLLDQDFFETLLSFIISQNNRIPQIKKVVADISSEWGGKKVDIGEISLNSFPSADDLKNVSRIRSGLRNKTEHERRVYKDRNQYLTPLIEKLRKMTQK